MGLKRVAVEELLHGNATFDAVVDARSESEFAEDHLPGAANWPVLNDVERASVGTEYKQVSAFDARKRGAALAAANIARHLQQHVQALPKGWRPLVYCWRGGQRSASLALVLSEIGFAVTVLEGGYRAFRRAVLADLETRPQRLGFQVLAGRTGSAKSRLLQALAAQGAQVLDLEALACHRGSVLGLVPGQRQPSQKAFETALWQVLATLDPTRPVFAEGESRTIGRLRVPEALLLALRAARVWRVNMAMDARVDFLLDDYAHFVVDTEAFCTRLEALRELRGAATIERWQGLARARDAATPVRELLEQHYDPVYLKSMRKHFAGFEEGATLELADAAPATLEATARRLIESTGTG
ncbi:MAG: tRNA 2-selenouridine(34) synthase MnmH [Ideonella sp. WA131b]|jgi:tRNA 2-selenouridine synthase|nr:tRNA 2-selenouridine(34) synthase MnmH [Ideonella sp. WA131b]